MNKSLFLQALVVGLLGGCISVPPAPNRSIPDASDPSTAETSRRSFRPNLIASTKVFLDPSVGEGAQKMGGMEGMDHSKMGGMEGMDHSKMKGMDHSKMPGMTSPPQKKEALENEMKKTSDEMKELSDELKAKSDAPKGSNDARQQSSPAHSHLPEGGQMQHQGSSPTSKNQSPQKLVYTCPMHPEVVQDTPGKCPKCGMKLVQKSDAP